MNTDKCHISDDSTPLPGAPTPEQAFDAGVRMAKGG